MIAMFAMVLMALSTHDRVDVSDLHRFPWPAKECARRWDMANTHACWMLTHSPYLMDWYADAVWRKECWDNLDNAHRYRATGSVSSMLNSLNNLRILLGDDNYSLGRMPDFLPAYRFYDR